MDFRKQAKESRTKKLHQLTVSAPDAKTDASDFTPYADPKMDKKTGKRPINPRNFKRGGKVAALEGATAKKRGDRMGAKGRKAKQVGGEISAEDKAKLAQMAGAAAKEKSAPRAANVPLPPRRPAGLGTKDEFRAKEDISSPYKKGGRTKKYGGGGMRSERTQQAKADRKAIDSIEKNEPLNIKRYLYQKSGETGKQTGYDSFGEDEMRRGGRTKKMIGGDITAGGNQQIPSAKGQTSLLRKAVGLDYEKGGKVKKMNGGPMMAGPAQTLMKRKTPMNNPAAKAPAVMPMRAKGGKVHSDEAMDKALIKKMVKPEARKEKMCGGRTKKKNGGGRSIEQYYKDSDYNPDVPYNVLTAPRDSDLKKNRVSESARYALAKRQRADYEGLENQAKFNTRMASEEGTGGDYGRAKNREDFATKQADYTRKDYDTVKEETGMKKGGRTKKAFGGASALAPRGGDRPQSPGQQRPERNYADRQADNPNYQAVQNRLNLYNSALENRGDTMNPERKQWLQTQVDYIQDNPNLTMPEFRAWERQNNPQALEEAARRAARASGAAAKGGRIRRKEGGRAKGKSNINIVIAPQPAAQGGMPPMGLMPPRPPMPMPMPPAPGAMPPGAGAMPMPMPVPVPMGGGAPAPQGAGVPGIPGMAPLPRKSGGRIKSYKDMTAGAGSGEGRLQKEEMQEYKRTARKAGGKVPNMTFGAGSGPGRIEKIHAYGENPHGEAAPKPKKRSWTM